MVDRGEAGAGLIGSTIGVMVFLLLLLLAVQVTFSLYATSTVTAATWDAARIASGSDAGEDPIAARAEAEAHLRSVLGRYGDRVTVRWSEDPDDVILSVRAEHPGFLPRALRHPMRLDAVERTVRVRIERVR